MGSTWRGMCWAAAVIGALQCSPDLKGGIDGIQITGGADAGNLPDGGRTAPDAGIDDAGMGISDGGVTPGDDAGTEFPPPPLDAGPPSDAGTASDAGITVVLPRPAGWQFLGPNEGGPQRVYSASADLGGNLWVAGGEEGLFVLERQATRMRRFTLADGLRPYGIMPDGSAPPGVPYLKVITVKGGPAGTVFVGYQGKPPPVGKPSCEDEWDTAHNEHRPADPDIYKSGDADRVTLNALGGIDVVHYDLSTGPNKIGNELSGREKLCNVYRIEWDASTNSLWFGANHGFAWGAPGFSGYSCHLTPGATWDYGCAGVMEHVHPAFPGWNASQTQWVLLTGEYYGVALAPNGDVWFGGANRTTLFKYGTYQQDYWRAQSDTEATHDFSNRIDLWPDDVGEPDVPTTAQRRDDNVSGMALMPDGSLWIGSFSRGLIHRLPDGTIARSYTVELVDRRGYVSAVVRDPSDDSVWAGSRWGPGLTRIQGDTLIYYNSMVFGDWGFSPILDIQVDNTGPTRRILVAFEGFNNLPGLVGIYTGP